MCWAKDALITLQAKERSQKAVIPAQTGMTSQGIFIRNWNQSALS